jgi:hypothetical protein
MALLIIRAIEVPKAIYNNFNKLSLVRINEREFDGAKSPIKKGIKS